PASVAARAWRHTIVATSAATITAVTTTTRAVNVAANTSAVATRYSAVAARSAVFGRTCRYQSVPRYTPTGIVTAAPAYADDTGAWCVARSTFTAMPAPTAAADANTR